jgi:FkbM family methyltransferase
MVDAFLHHGAGWVVAVEPEEKDIEHMRIRFAHPCAPVAFQCKAVGPEIGTGILSINHGARSCSTFVPDIAWGEDTLLRGLPVDERREVPMTTLDQLIDDYGVPDFVNMSIVRFEYQALCGLSQPIPHLSFAVTHDTIKEGWAVKAVDRITEISPNASFNYTDRSVLIKKDGEFQSAPTRWLTWKGPQSIKRIFPDIDELGLWGHIQVRMN